MKAISKNNVKILDCTLRDGGYINDWNFGELNIKKIFKALSSVGIDYIEVGFLKDTIYEKNKTVFNSFDEIKNVTGNSYNQKSKIAAMLVYGKFDCKKVIQKNKDILIDVIRFNFKKHETLDALECMKKVKDCGYDLFICPANIEMFSKIELRELIKKSNDIMPQCFSIVDTNGVLRESDTRELFELIDENLDSKISVGFHSHNNLGLSIKNAKHLTALSKNRNLIIDSSLSGMGRGAGNICTEELLRFLNNQKYDEKIIFDIIESNIEPLKKAYSWGYSIPYYLSAINRCHPNYSKYLINHGVTSPQEIDSLLKKLPAEKKSLYSEEIIKSIV